MSEHTPVDLGVIGTVDFGKIAAEVMADRKATSVDTAGLANYWPGPNRQFACLSLMDDAARLPNPIHKLERLGLAHRGIKASSRVTPPAYMEAYERELFRVLPAIVNRLDSWLSDGLSKKRTGKGQLSHATKVLGEFDKRAEPFIGGLPGAIRAEYDRARSHMADQVALLSKYA